ncbi:MAG: DNA repair protein RadC [Desulfobacterales bacterium]|nr:DNA repair protein RadC [Desulfobacterales bacterium]
MSSSDVTPHKGRGHRKRLRDKFLSAGLAGFHDYEVIELLLTLANPRKDCKDSAKLALEKFKTLQNVFEASDNELCALEGIGPQNVFGLRLIKAVADRYLEKKLVQQGMIRHSKELFDYLYHSIRDKTRECFKVVFLDAKNKVIKAETLFQGTLTAASVYPREVVREALACHAAALIFAHNHPSGDPEPSADDVSITRRLVFACRVMGIAVHEHLVIGNNTYFSFADHGHIERMNQEAESRLG